MANQTGISITIKAFLPTGKDIKEQLDILTTVQEAMNTRQFGTLLDASTIDDVQTKQITRRIPDKVLPEAGPASEGKVSTDDEDNAPANADPDEEIPAFLREEEKGRGRK